MKYRVGIDIGGTFTDFAVLDESSRLYTLKVFTTPTSPGSEIIEGIRALETRYGIKPDEISYLTHGTTVGVNSLIQRDGAKLCLLTTQNFEDVLELGRLKSPDVFNLFSKRPAPLISRDRVFPVVERILASGDIELPLDETNVEQAVENALALQADGIVVALINSYSNPVHEQRVKEIANRMAPDLFVTCSSETWAVVREYERTVTAVINAFVQPKMVHYLNSLQRALRDEGVSPEPQMTKSNGGVMRAELAKNACVEVLLSGTASGVTGAAFIARLSGFPDIASIDIGGTSADVALIVGGEPQFGTGEQIGDFALYVPSVAVSSVGGGGGSIAWADTHGVLKSGPMSAGSEPGPACYGRGGTLPTTTDAFVACGFLAQTELAYGNVTIDRQKAEAAIESLGKTLSMGIRETAEAIISVAVSGMYAGMTKAFAQHGVDPKTLALMAFGGGGPMMACHLAREIGIESVVVPATPGVLSALGGLVSDTKNDFISTVYRVLDADMVKGLEETYADLAARARTWLKDDQRHAGEPNILFSADMRYAGQSFEIETVLEESWIAGGDLESIASAFHAQHERLYDYSDLHAPVQIINARVVISAPNPKPDFTVQQEDAHQPQPERIITVFTDGEERQAGLFLREKLLPGAMLEGPAVIAQSDTTTIVIRGFSVRVDGYGNLILTQSSKSN